MINPSDLLLHVDIRLPEGRPVLYIYIQYYLPMDPTAGQTSLVLDLP